MLQNNNCTFLAYAFPSVSGFHINSCCHLTAALQGLFSAAGSSLTPVCQGEAAMIEGEYDLAQTGLQHNSFYDRKSWIWLHLSCWKAVDWTSHLVTGDALSILNVNFTFTRKNVQLCSRENSTFVYSQTIVPNITVFHWILLILMMHEDGFNHWFVFILALQFIQKQLVLNRWRGHNHNLECDQ